MINEMKWDLVVSTTFTKGACHLAKVTKIPVTGSWRKVEGEPELTEFILGPDSHWHTGATYRPVDEKTSKALWTALREYEKHEKRVGEKLKEEAAARNERRQNVAKARSLEGTVICKKVKTKDGSKLHKALDSYDVRRLLQDEGWKNVRGTKITLFKSLDRLGTFDAWVALDDDLGASIQITLQAEDDDEERRRKIEERKKAKKEEREQKKRLKVEEEAKAKAEKERREQEEAERKEREAAEQAARKKKTAKKSAITVKKKVSKKKKKKASKKKSRR